MVPAHPTIARPDKLFRKQGMPRQDITVGSDVWGVVQWHEFSMFALPLLLLAKKNQD